MSTLGKAGGVLKNRLFSSVSRRRNLVGVLTSGERWGPETLWGLIGVDVMKQSVEEEGGQTAAAITVHLVRWPRLIGPAARILREDPPRSCDYSPCVAPPHSSSSSSSSPSSVQWVAYVFTRSPGTQITLRDGRQSEIWTQTGSLNMFNA